MLTISHSVSKLVTALLLLLVALSSAHAQSTWEQNVNRPGSDIRNFFMQSADPRACQQACQGDRNCQTWTYSHPGGGRPARCWLKRGEPAATVSTCCISGVIRRPGQGPGVGTANRAPICNSFASHAARWSLSARRQGCTDGPGNDINAGNHFNWCMARPEAEHRGRSPQALGHKQGLERHCSGRLGRPVRL